MRVLMTGATGFIGGALARALLREGHELVCAVRDPSRLQLGEGRWQALQVDLQQVPTSQWWQPHLAGIDAVVNCVGIIRETADATFDALHARAPRELFFACAAAGVGTVVQVSALGADDEATSRYHLTKCQADELLRGLRVAGAVLQPSVVYGPGASSAPMFHLMAAMPLLALPAAGAIPMQPVHVDDVVAGILAVLKAPPRPVATVACVGPRYMTMAQYLRQLRAALAIPGPQLVLRLPRFIFMTTARLASLLPGSVLDGETAGMLLRGSAAPVDDFHRLLGRLPRGVDRFVDPADAQALRAGIWRDLGRLARKGLVALAAVAVLAWWLLPF